MTEGWPGDRSDCRRHKLWSSAFVLAPFRSRVASFRQKGKAGGQRVKPESKQL